MRPDLPFPPLLFPAAVLAISSVTLPQETPETPKTKEPQESERHGLIARRGSEAADDWTAWRNLTGDWGGARSSLEERGVSLLLSAIVDSSYPFAGGVRKRRSDRVLLDAALELDLERLLGWPRATLFIEGYSLSGPNASIDVGDIQIFSNIDEKDVTQLAELWFEQRSDDRRFRAKLGKLDANGEFAYVDAGLAFLHSSAGFSPTIFLLPTYPDPAVSLNVFARLNDGWRLGLGLYNADVGGAVSGRRGLTADFDAAFWIGQIDRFWDGGRLALGTWLHDGTLARFDGGTEDDTGGWYAILEQRLSTEGMASTWTGFLQWGSADEDVSPFASHLAAGVLAKGLIPGLETWHSGLYLSHAELTDEPGSGLNGGELAIELFQEIPLMPSVLLKPDLQWIQDASGRDDAWVATLRIEIVF